MIFQNNFLRVVGLMLFTFCCGKNPLGANKAASTDTIQIDGMFFQNEKIVIKANNVTVYERDLDLSKPYGPFADTFMVDNSVDLKLQVQTLFKDRVFIDTTFNVPAGIYIESVGGSNCFPTTWKILSIDSCKRYFLLMPDSIKTMNPS